MFSKLSSHTIVASPEVLVLVGALRQEPSPSSDALNNAMAIFSFTLFRINYYLLFRIADITVDALELPIGSPKSVNDEKTSANPTKPLPAVVHPAEIVD